MSPLLLTLLFAMVALVGFALIVHGIRLKPGDGANGEERVVLEFFDAPGESAEMFDLDSDREILRQGQKRLFDSKKHRPEEIETLKDSSKAHASD